MVYKWCIVIVKYLQACIECTYSVQARPIRTRDVDSSDEHTN